MLAHSTIDAELRKWEEGVSIGFVAESKAEATECVALERKAQALEKELKHLTQMLPKRKLKRDKQAEDLAEKEKLKRYGLCVCAWVCVCVCEGEDTENERNAD